MRFAWPLALLLVTLPAHADTSATPEGIDLERIMADPDWIGNPPENYYWSDDGRAVYFDRKREGNALRDLYVVSPETATPRKVADAELGAADAPGGDYTRDFRRKVFARNGDVFLKDIAQGTLRQITRTAQAEEAPFFMADERRIAFRVEKTFYAWDPDSGLVMQLTDVRAEQDPAAPEAGFDYLKEQQLRLFATLREEKARREAVRRREQELGRADPSRPPQPVYLGDDVAIENVALSPSGRWLLVVTLPKSHDAGQPDKMPNFVSDSGYVEIRDVRTLVNRRAPAGRTLVLVDLETGTWQALDTGLLPGIKDDPFAHMRDGAIAWHVRQGADRKAVEKLLEPPKQRAVTVERILWNDTGDEVAVQLRAIDNKDRWLATVDLARKRLVTQHRLTDNAWINWAFNEFGWLPDGKTLWYLSEESGWSHLYVKPLAERRARQLTRGAWEVSSPAPDRAGRYFYFTANREHPGRYEVYRVPASGGAVERLTYTGVRPENLRQTTDSAPPFLLSPDETRLLFRHDTPVHPPELYVQSLAAGAEPVRLTHTVSEAFTALPWTMPEIVAVPSSSVDRPIYARVYLPKGFDPARRYPAVMFVHGAGYLQNVHYHWSHYFREFMFHTLLTLHGYVVMDMDYRGSEGYGRDWRTAIYRQMGHPEVDDYRDGLAWLVKNRAVDPARVGIYGGSYGGFLTFMALFREPDLFAAGAALRPVTDWAHYNHEYTSNILNTPEIDPVAYAQSSPIEFAAGLKKPLLICHGMQDDNVFFKDTVRLVQRLIELKKEDFETAFYPLDPHGFVHPASWLDEYRRIFKLFETHLKKSSG
ncbi:MAG TPA: prolyl oligopeptidase family serine peptidase [Gammaproteobacteria bacterium]|nr:prolyl oligopeptidase family serine peptidase [Gammaproteobacteria bacterium]